MVSESVSGMIFKCHWMSAKRNEITRYRYSCWWIFIRFAYRWLKPIFAIGLKRAIEEDDIYAIKNDMKSDSNTEAFAKLWELEQKKKSPSLFRVMYKMYLRKLLPIGVLFAIGETVARYSKLNWDIKLKQTTQFYRV